MRRLALLAAAGALVLGLGAQPVAARQGATIVETAIAVNARTGEFDHLIAAVVRTGLVETLNGRRQLTVFAPTDAAFKKIPRSTLNSLAKNRAKLRAVLLYHVVAGRVPSSQVVMLKSAKTLNGKSVRIHTAGGKVFVNNAKVTKTDINASNGIIHVVNRVLIPPAH